jgi:site-specific DNA-methyltransferase (adenine-specific)
MSDLPKDTVFDLHHGDCVEGMAELPPNSVDVVVTSPPYNLGIDYRSFKDTATRADYLDWCLVWAAAVKRVLRDDGSFFLNVGAAPKNPFMPHELLLKMRDLFELQNTIHWIKSITVEQRDGTQISAGHFKPINSPRYINDCHEYLFHFTKEGTTKLDRRAAGVPYQDKSNIDRWGHTGGEDKRCRGNTWFVPYKTITSRDKERPHPATFPVELARRALTLHGKGAATVAMDPFLGIGHAALAAAEYGAAKFIGFEIDDYYIEEARRQVSTRQGELPLD